MDVHELEHPDAAQEERQYKIKQPNDAQDTCEPLVEPSEIAEEVVDRNNIPPEDVARA